jgi:hypothetical protein
MDPRDTKDTTHNTTFSILERDPATLSGAKLVAVNNLALTTPALIEDAAHVTHGALDVLDITIWSDTGMVGVMVPWHASSSVTIQD